MSDTRAERAPDPDLAAALQEAERALREALKFYADENNWTQPTSWGGRILDDESEAIADQGSRARAALAAAAAPSEGVNEPGALKGLAPDQTETPVAPGSLTPRAAPSGEPPSEQEQEKAKNLEACCYDPRCFACWKERNDALEAIALRWSTIHDRGAHDYTDAGCRVLAEHAFRDVASLLTEVEQLRQIIGGPPSGERDAGPQLTEEPT